MEAQPLTDRWQTSPLLGPSGRRWLLAGAILLGAFLFVLAPLVTGELAPVHDADGFFVPYYTLLADFTRAGKLLLWNPWTSGGSPDHIEPQVGTLSPQFLLSALITGGGEGGYRAHWIACWLWGLLGMLALGRRMGAHPAAAGAVALAFALSGPFLGHAQHLSFMYSYAVLPVALCRLDAALEEDRPLAALQAGAVWGLSALGGYPGVLLITGAILMLWAGGRALAGGAGGDTTWGLSHRVSLRRAAVLLAWCFGAGLLVMLPAVLPMLVDGKGFSDRAGTLSREVVIGSNALHPRALATLFSPYLATLPPARVWPYTDISSCSLYLGVVPLLLAVHALVARPRSALRWWLLGVAVLFVGIALGRVLPLRGWLYDLVPPTRYVRHAAIYRLGTVFALAVLACLGARDLVRERGRGLGRWAPLLVASVLAIAALVAYGAVTELAPSASQSAGDRHLWIAWSALVLLAAAAGRLEGQARRLTLLIGLPALVLYDARATFQLANTVGSAALVQSWRSLDARRVRSLDLLPGGLARLPYSNDSTGYGPGPTDKNLLPKIPAFVGYAPLSNDLHFRWARTPALAARVLSADRIYFAPSAIEVAPSAAAFAAFASSAVKRGDMPLLVHRRATMPQVGSQDPVTPALADQLAKAPPAVPVAVTWKRYTPEALELEVDAPQSGWLLVTDRWARGWRARIDGRETPVEGGNFLFRALPVSRGKHKVEMSYHPFGLFWIALASWGTLLAVIAGTLWQRRRRRRSIGQRERAE